ncbi:hypothetical protein Dimus_021447 [Dionaea muscipula]
MRVIYWIPSYPDQVKLNFDGGYSPHLDRATRAGILRKSDGTTLMTFMEMLPHGTTSYDGEAMALLRGLELSYFLGYKKIWTEGDAKFLIETINGTRSDDRYGLETITKIQKILKKFEVYDVSFVHREANEATNELTRVRRRTSTDAIFIGEEELPKDVMKIVERE